MMNRKKFRLLPVFIVIIVFWGIIFLILCSTREQRTRSDLANLNYRTDVEPLKNHFPYLNEVTQAFWKSGRYGDSLIGPSDVWLKGFVLLNNTDFDNLKSQYEWHKTEVIFEEGVNPNITGFEYFEWYLSKDFSEYLNQNTFMGDFYLDKNNGILYFDLSTY